MITITGTIKKIQETKKGNGAWILINDTENNRTVSGTYMIERTDRETGAMQTRPLPSLNEGDPITAHTNKITEGEWQGFKQFNCFIEKIDGADNEFVEVADEVEFNDSDKIPF